MFRRTEQGTEDTPTRDEHAYEDNWYRSLKALAEHRAAEEAAETEGSPDEPRPDPSPDGDAEAVDADHADAGHGPDEPPPSQVTTPAEDLGTRVEEPAVPVDVSGAPPEASEVEELSARTDQLIERLRTLRNADETDAPTVERGSGPEGPPGASSEELGTRAQQLLERLRTLRTLGDVEEPR